LATRASRRSKATPGTAKRSSGSPRACLSTGRRTSSRSTTSRATTEASSNTRVEKPAKRTGLNLVAAPPNDEGAPPHCHSAEEEVFVVLDGEGTLELWGPPKAGAPPATEPSERHPLRRGHVVSRPAGTRVSHSFRAGSQGLTYLAYGTRDSNDIAYYPRSNKIFFRGLGLIARLEPLDYSDGEPA
jgi:uncharacterized cupin superfamily protein